MNESQDERSRRDSAKHQATESAEQGVIEEPEDALPAMTIEQLPGDLREAAARAQWTELMPVQSKAIPYLLAGRDLMVQSRTGSGKTGAFVLPMMARVDPRKKNCQVLVLVPTRELAKQVSNEATILAGDSGVRVVAVYGGVSYKPQLDAFKAGTQIVVGTPGRVLDHLIRRSLSLDALKMLVFDEADRMLSMGFLPDMRRIQEMLPSRHVNAYLFSATFPAHVRRLAIQFLDEPAFLSLSRDHVHVTDTEHAFYSVPAMSKDRWLVRIIELENPTAALIFCNTRERVHYVNVVLQRFGFNADELSSDLSQQAREKVLRRLRDGSLRFLVATDVASRGIDVPELSHVFLYETPDDPEDYIHRAGRTGRAGAVGTAISVVSGMERSALVRIGKRYGIQFDERPLPEDEELENMISQRAIALLEAELRSRDKLMVERMQRFLPLAQRLAENDESISLLAMLIDDAYHGAVHASRQPLQADNGQVEQPSEVDTGKKDRKPRRRRSLRGRSKDRE